MMTIHRKGAKGAKRDNLFVRDISEQTIDSQQPDITQNTHNPHGPNMHSNTITRPLS